MSKTSNISIRFSDDELQTIDTKAIACNMSRSEYIRFLIKAESAKELIPKKQLLKLIHKISCIIDTTSKKELESRLKKELKKWL